MRLHGKHRALTMLCCLLAVPSVASAAEGGSSIYLQGTYNDFAPPYGIETDTC
jgi:hypothetical protein